MSIKKQYQELVAFLQENENKKVSTIMDDVLLMVETKKKDSTYLQDSEGNTIAIFCYYHKQWELLGVPDEKHPELVEYGSKINTKTGYNTMCKVGVSKWTKAQRDAKQANQDLLTNVASGEIEPKDILDLQANIEIERTTMNIEDMPEGTLEAPTI